MSLVLFLLSLVTYVFAENFCLRQVVGFGKLSDASIFSSCQTPIEGDELLVREQSFLVVENTPDGYAPVSAVWLEDSGFIEIQLDAFLSFSVDSDPLVPATCNVTLVCNHTATTTHLSEENSLILTSTDVSVSNDDAMHSTSSNHDDPNSIENDVDIDPLVVVGAGGGLVAVAALVIAFLVVSKQRSSSKDDSSAKNGSQKDVKMDTFSDLPGHYNTTSSSSSSQPSETGYVKPPAVKPSTSSTAQGESEQENPDSNIDTHIIKLDELDKEHKIGEGHFGTVWKGTWHHTEVAIKEVKGVSEQARRDIMSEAQHFARMQPHSNVVQFFGICSEQGLKIVLEFCDGGCLVKALYEGPDIIDFSPKQLATIAIGAGRGLAHLHLLKICHQDIAARNVLLTGDYKPKLTDFGMARVQETEKKAGDVGPIKWMSPEQLNKQPANFPSDVWAYGVLLYEIYAKEPPWKGLTTEQVVKRVRDGERMSVPEGTPEHVATVMKLCWHGKIKQRATMNTVLSVLEPLASSNSSRRKKRRSGKVKSRSGSVSAKKGPQPAQMPEGYELPPKGFAGDTLGDYQDAPPKK